MARSYLPETEADFQSLRKKLVMYFAGRKMSPAEDYADEVILRALTKISEGEEVEDINKYVFGIARFVRMEAFREPKKVSLDPSGFVPDESDESKPGRRLPRQLIVDPYEIAEDPEEKVCLRKCLAVLDDHKRNMLIGFYKIKGTDKNHKEQRKQLANENGMTTDTLYTSICRLRKKVGGCVGKCLEEKNSAGL